MEVNIYLLLLIIKVIAADVMLNKTEICKSFSLNNKYEKGIAIGKIISSDILENETFILLTNIDANINENINKAINSGAEALLIKSSSIVEDVIWNSKSFEDPSGLLIFLIPSNCNINRISINDKIYEISASTNPFKLTYWIPIIIILNIWNIVNIQLILRKIRKAKKLPLFYLNLELINDIIRIIVLIEPLPLNLFHTHLSFTIFYSVNFSLTISIILVICAYFLEITFKNGGRKLSLLIEYNTSRNYFKRISMGLYIVCALLSIDIVFSVLRGNFIALMLIEKIILIYYLVLITVTAIICIITFIEVKNLEIVDPSLFKYLHRFTYGLCIVLIGLVFFLITPNEEYILPLKLLPLYVGCLFISTTNILYCINRK